MAGQFYKYGDSPKEREEAFSYYSGSGGETFKAYVSSAARAVEELPPPEPITFEEALIDRLDRITRLLNQFHDEVIRQRVAAEMARRKA